MSYLLSGNARAGFVRRDHENPTFYAGVSPHIHFKFFDKGFFEGGMDLTFDDRKTKVNLLIASLYYFLNDRDPTSSAPGAPCSPRTQSGRTRAVDGDHPIAVQSRATSDLPVAAWRRT